MFNGVSMSPLIVPLVTLIGTLVINLITMSKQKGLGTSLQKLSMSQDKKHEIYPEFWQKIHRSWDIADKFILSDEISQWFTGTPFDLQTMLRLAGYTDDQILELRTKLSILDEKGMATFALKLRAHAILIDRNAEAKEYFEKWKPYFDGALLDKIQEMLDVLENVAIQNNKKTVSQIKHLHNEIETLVRKELSP